MAFTGKLEEIHVPDLLQILSAGNKSGTLRLTRRDANGLVVFRQGRIIYAASSSGRETLGSQLLARKLITEKDLLDSLDKQREAPEERRLGTILVESGALTQESLEELIVEQVERVIKEILDWRSGFFQFDVGDLADHGEIGVDARGFLLSKGLSADKVLIKIAGELESQETGAPPTEPAPADGDAEPQPVAVADDREGFLSAAATLRTVMAEIRSPEFTGELTIRIMSFATTLVARGVLFYLRRGHFCGMGQFGIELGDASADEAVRGIRMPVDQPSVLRDVAERKTTYRGKLVDTEWNRYLLRELGGITPREVMATPLVVNSAALLIFYGDTGSEGRPIGSLSEFEVLMLQAGLAVEKQLLEKRIEQFKQLRTAE